LAEDLIFNRHPDALPRFIAAFEGVTLEKAETEDPTEGLTAEERVRWRILYRKKEGIRADLDEILQQQVYENAGVVDFQTQPGFQVPNPATSAAAAYVINRVLLPAMKEVGDRFGAGELILPFVLQSAEVMKRAVGHVEKYLERQEGVSKGTVVLATVYGDVHDIGKNLVKTILVNNGYTVHDLGKQVQANIIIDKAVEVNADAIGLSALLVSTSRQMPLIVNELHKRGLAFPVLIGGAAINRKFGLRILFTDAERGKPYTPGVFYCKDAFEGLETMGQLQDPEQHEALIAHIQEEGRRELGLKGTRASIPEPLRTSAVSQIRPAVPTPPVWGPRVIHDMPLPLVFECLHKPELFRLSWGAKNTRGDEWQRLQAIFETRLAQMMREALRDGWLEPRAVYGYWPAQSDGNELVLYDPQDRQTELSRFWFPRQESKDYLCLADYFAPVESDVMDVVALQVVTVGRTATERFEALESAGNYSEAYYAHGLAVQVAEAAAEYVHRHIRRELALPPDRGKRYSWGYPAIPELEDHRKVFALLPAEAKLGMSLTAAFQLVPEQSTAAIVVHHPEARYFGVGDSRIEQLERALKRPGIHN
jgi:5-methyltetrahydrofolate--homocysteine methyltransferase